MSRATWPALAVDRFLCESHLIGYRRVFGAFDLADESGMWQWLADAPLADVTRWCKRLKARNWRLGLDAPVSLLPWFDSGRGRR